MSKKILYYYFAVHLAVLLLLMSFVFIAVPTTDDYAFCVSSRALSVWGAVEKMFTGWGGRYAQAFVASVWYKFEELTGVPYFVGLLLFICMFFSGIYSFLGIFLGRKTDRKLRLALSIIFIAGIFRSLPTLDESIYWNIGGITYLLPATIFLYFLNLFYYSYINNKSWLLQPVLILLIFFADGINEAFVVFNILVTFAVIVYMQFLKKGSKAYYLTLLAALAGLAVISSSEGNSVRMNIYPDSGKFLYSILWGSLSGTQAIIQAAADPYIWGSILLFSSLLKEIRGRLPRSLLNLKVVALFVVTLLLMLYAVVAIHYYATGNRPVQRLMVVWYIIFYLGIFSLSVFIAPQVCKLYEFLSRIVGRILRGRVLPGSILFAVVFAAFLLINNPPKAVYDLIFNVPGFIKENDEFIKAAEELQNSDASPKVLVIEKFKHRPILLKAPTDADYGMKTYFGFDEVKIIDKK